MIDITTYATAISDFKGRVGDALFTVSFDKDTRLHIRIPGTGKLAIHTVAAVMLLAVEHAVSHTPEGELRAIAARLLTTFGMEVVNGADESTAYTFEIAALKTPTGKTVRATMSGLDSEGTWKVLAYGHGDQIAEIAKAYRELEYARYNKGKSKGDRIAA